MMSSFEEPRIPPRFYTLCDICKNPDYPIDIRSFGIAQYTSGWVLQRPGGGGHAIALPKRENRWAHSCCIEKEGKGLTGQQSLFTELTGEKR